MPDSQVNYLQQDASGNTFALFPGGVQIAAAASGPFVPGGDIRWNRQSDGAMIAELAASNDDAANTRQMLMTLAEPNALFGSAGMAQIIMAGGTAQQYSTAVQGVPQGGGLLRSATLVRDDGASSFLKLANGDIQRLSISFAFCLAAGGTANPRTTDVTSARLGVGAYRVSYADRAGGAVVFAQIRNPAGANYQALVLTDTTHSVIIEPIDPGIALVDADFAFMCIGGEA